MKTEIAKFTKKGFSLVELLVVVVIITLLSGAAFVGIQRTKARLDNDKMLDDLIAVANALEQYKRDHFGKYPIPAPGGNMNLNCYYADATYAHDCEAVDVSFRQGMIDNNLLSKRYLSEIPTDPRTGSRYVYGVSNDGAYFQVAGNFLPGSGTPVAKVVGNVVKGFHLPSLIRAYDGPNFVLEDESNLPYSPDALVVSATLQNVNGEVMADGASAVSGQMVFAGNTLTTGSDGTVDLYFSDGSVSSLEKNSTLIIKSESTVEQNDSNNIITRIRLKITQGKIWSKVARLASKSEFNIETTGAIAGVRGTEFGVEQQLDADADIVVRSGIVDILDKDDTSNVLWVMAADNTDPNNPVPVQPDEPWFCTVSADGTSDGVYALDMTHQNDSNVEFINENYDERTLTNNDIPHLLSINSGTITFANPNRFNLDGLPVAITNVLAYNADDMTQSIGGWAAISSADGITPIAVNATGLTGEKVVFQFQDGKDNVSGVSQPPITIDATTELMEADLNPNMVIDETQTSADTSCGALPPHSIGFEPDGTCLPICNTPEGYIRNDFTTECQCVATSGVITYSSPAGDASTRPYFEWMPSPSCLFEGAVYGLKLDGTVLAANLGVTNYRPDQPLAPGNHSWEVVAQNGTGPITITNSAQSFRVMDIPPVCGNGYAEANGTVIETCDDGNNLDRNTAGNIDGCDANCKTVPGYYCPPAGGPCALKTINIITPAGSNLTAGSLLYWKVSPEKAFKVSDFSVSISGTANSALGPISGSGDIYTTSVPSTLLSGNYTWTVTAQDVPPVNGTFTIASILPGSLTLAQSGPFVVSQPILLNIAPSLATYQVVKDGTTIASASSLNPFIPTQSGNYALTLNQAPNPIVTFNVITQAQADCTSSVGVWDIALNRCKSNLEMACTPITGQRTFILNLPDITTDDECWVLGGAGQSCGDPDNTGPLTGACEDKGLICDTSNWNDNLDRNSNGFACDICSTLTGLTIDQTFKCTEDPNSFAPFSAGTVCRYSNTTQSCASAPNTQQRVCKCK